MRVVAMPANVFQSMPDKSVLLSTTFECAHDAFSEGGVRMAPHLIADFTDVSKQMADIIAKCRMQDNEQRLYELTARNAEKLAQKAGKKLEKATKAVDVATKKLQAASSKSNAKQNKLLAKAQKAAANAQVAFDKASKAADAASKKVALVFNIQSDIIQRWQHVIVNMKPAALCTGDDVALPACTESCQLFLAPCSKCKDSKCRCTFAL